MDFKIVDISHSYSGIMSNCMIVKKKNPNAFTIPRTIGVYQFGKVLYDLGVSLNFIPQVIFSKLGLRTPKHTTLKFLMVDQFIK